MGETGFPHVLPFASDEGIAMNRLEFSELIKQRCQELGVNVFAPYQFTDTDGSIIEYAAHLPDYGSPNDMVIDILDNKINNSAQREFARQHGHWLSIVNPDPWINDVKNVREALKDWGNFAERRERAHLDGFDRIMAQKVGQPSIDGDELN